MNKNLLYLFQASIATLFYLIILELLGAWSIWTDTLGFGDISNKYYVLIQGAIQAIAVLTFIFFNRGRTLKGIIKKISPKWYLIAFALGTSFIYLQTPLNWIYNFLFSTEYNIKYNSIDLSRLANINFISAIVLIPIGEELFFRGYIQNSLQKKTNYGQAILWASVLFALIHAPYINLLFEESNQDWHLTYLAFFGGIISGLIYYKSNSITPSIIFHISWNLAAYIL